MIITITTTITTIITSIMANWGNRDTSGHWEWQNLTALLGAVGG